MLFEFYTGYWRAKITGVNIHQHCASMLGLMFFGTKALSPLHVDPGGNLPPFSVARTGSSIWSNHFLSAPLKTRPSVREDEREVVRSVTAGVYQSMSRRTSSTGTQACFSSTLYQFLRVLPVFEGAWWSRPTSWAPCQHKLCGERHWELSSQRRLWRHSRGNVWSQEDRHSSKQRDIHTQILSGWVHVDRSFTYTTCDPLTALTYCHTQYVPRGTQ